MNVNDEWRTVYRENPAFNILILNRKQLFDMCSFFVSLQSFLAWVLCNTLNTVTPAAPKILLTIRN